MRGFHRPLLAALLLAVLAFVGGTRHADAQMTNTCCTFHVTVSNLVPNACMPISVTTNWGVLPGKTQTDVITVKGGGNPASAITPCPLPPGPQLNWISLDGGTTQYAFPSMPPGGYKITLPCGFCVTLDAGYDINGCIEIFVRGSCL